MALFYMKYSDSKQRLVSRLERENHFIVRGLVLEPDRVGICTTL